MSLSSSRTTIYNEVFDENSLPSEEEIREYAVKIGINPESEPHLLHLARDGLMQALPPDWKPCFDEELNAWYYFNFRSGESRWEHPLDDVYRMLVRKGRSESVSSAGDDDSKTSLKEDLKSYEEAVTSDMLSRNADPFKGSAGFRKASLQLAPLRKATTRSESSLLSAALAGPGGGVSSSFGPASPSLASAAVSSRANTMTRSDSAPAAVAVASASSPWLQLGAGGEQAEGGFSVPVPVPVPAPPLQRIDIDKMEPAIASSSSSSRAAGRQRLASAKEKHPRTMHGRSELTLSGGGSIFLKSNKAQTPDTPDTPLVSPAQPTPTIEVVSSMGPGDTLPKSILRGDPHARSSASKLLWDLDPREMSYEEKHMWRRQELEEERKSVRFNLDKDLDIRFNISDSEGENEENGEGEEVVGGELDKEEDWNTDDEEADEDRYIAGVKVSDILNLMDASELDEPSPKELINLPMLSEDNPETQVERQGLADEADDLEICISSEKDMIDMNNGAEESTNHKQRSSETQEQISIDLQKAISGGDSLESEEAPKLEESSSALPLPVVEVTPPPPSPLPSPPADVVAQPQLPEVTSEPPSEELGKLTDSLKEEDEAEEEEVVVEIEDKNEANISEEVKQEEEEEGKEEVENTEASDQKSNLNASSKPSFPPLVGAHSASELIADLRKALDLADEGLQKSNQKGLKDSIEEEPKEEKIEQDDTKSLSQSTQKSEEKLQFVSEKQLIEPKQAQKQGQLKSHENEAENKEAELLVEQRHQKMYQLQVESQKMLRAFQEQLQMNTDTAIHRLEEQHAHQLAQLQEQLLQAEDEEKSRLQLEVFSRLSCFRQDLQMQQEAQEASIRENVERSLAELRTTLAAERETQLEEQRTMLQAHLEEERTNLQAEANRQLEELRTEMSESNRLKLEEVRAVLEVEGEAHVAQMREEMVAKRAEVEEKHQQELAVLEDKAQEALTARLQSRLDELETTALSEAASQLEEKLEVQKQSVLEKHRSNLEQLNTQHAEACEKLREEYHKEEEILKKAYAERLEELRVHLELERQRLRNRDQQEEERERDKMLESSRVLEKLRCEKRLLEDKYRSLKEKYIRLKTDVKLSIERRKRRETGGTTTGSETERSTSHTRTSVGVSSMTRPPDTDRERILPSGA